MHHLFNCSNCEAPLADIDVSYPNENFQFNFIVECPHCGDKSYQKTISGIFSIGPSPESESYTQIVDYDMDANPNYVLVKTQQLKPFKK